MRPETEAPWPRFRRLKAVALAVAIGLLVVGGTAAAFIVLTERDQNDLAEGWRILLFQMLWAAAPFLFLALAGVRTKLPWLAGLALTLLLWGYYLFVGVRYQWNPDGSGADIGLGLLLLISPLFITAACFGTHAMQRRQGVPSKEAVSSSRYADG